MDETIKELLKQREKINNQLVSEIYNEGSYIDEAQRAVDNFDRYYGAIIAASINGTKVQPIKTGNES